MIVELIKHYVSIEKAYLILKNVKWQIAKQLENWLVYNIGLAVSEDEK